MAKIICICGKICSGKSRYAETLRRDLKAAVLSCDELMLSLFDPQLGDKHEETAARVKAYLYKKSLELLEVGISVILDWGFWSSADRESTRDFYRSKGFECEFHYIDISPEDWQANIEERNAAVLRGETSAYYVDEGLFAKAERGFRPPQAGEIDVWYKNTRNI